MRLGVHIPCYKLTHFLPAVLESVKHIDRIVVTNSSKPWDDTESQEDNTKEICEASGLDNLEFIHGFWPQDSEHYQRNMAMRLMSDCDFIYVLDSDEIMLIGDQRKLLEFALSNPQYDGYAVNCIPYFNSLSEAALYDEGATPLCLVRPSCKFFITRCIHNPWIHCKDVSMHHFKFMQPSKDIGWRINAKEESQKRKFNGIKKVEKSIELENFLIRCGCKEFEPSIKESEIVSA